MLDKCACLFSLHAKEFSSIDKLERFFSESVR